MSYLVSITFDSFKLNEKETLKHVLKHTEKEKIIEFSNNNLKLLIILPPEEGIGELENIIYYILEGGELGVCTDYSKL